MKPKNIKRYQKDFKEIPSDQIERIHTFLNDHKFRDKDIKDFHKKLKDISSISYDYIKIVFDIIPEPTPRPRAGFGGRFYVKNSRTNNEFCKLMVKDHKELYHFISTPCEMTVRNYFPIPTNFSKVDTLLAELGMISMIKKPDWDNLGKTYSDMIQQWILSNDSLITKGTSEKYYSLKPRVEIILKYKTDYDSIHNKRLVEQSISFKKGNDCDEKEEF